MGRNLRREERFNASSNESPQRTSITGTPSRPAADGSAFVSSGPPKVLASREIRIGRRSPIINLRSTGQVFETESAYNYIQVVERGGVRYLMLN
ncbi:MAG: hypothetical protein P8Z34_15595, partial [Anaerolineales bacterium]